MTPGDPVVVDDDVALRAPADDRLPPFRQDELPGRSAGEVERQARRHPRLLRTGRPPEIEAEPEGPAAGAEQPRHVHPVTGGAPDVGDLRPAVPFGGGEQGVGLLDGGGGLPGERRGRGGRRVRRRARPDRWGDRAGVVGENPVERVELGRDA